MSETTITWTEFSGEEEYAGHYNGVTLTSYFADVKGYEVCVDQGHSDWPWRFDIRTRKGLVTVASSEYGQFAGPVVDRNFRGWATADQAKAAALRALAAL